MGKPAVAQYKALQDEASERLAHLKAPKAYAAVASGTTGRASSLKSLVGVFRGTILGLLRGLVLLNAFAAVRDCAAVPKICKLCMPFPDDRKLLLKAVMEN